MRRAPTRRWGSARPFVAVPVALALLAGVGCTSDDDGGSSTSTTQAAAAGDRTLRLGVVSLFEFDPAAVVPTEQGQMMAVDLLYDGLTTVDPETSEALPALAEEWTADDDNTVWTFTLRDDAMFSDGTPVTPEDVKFSLERVAELGSPGLAGVRLEVIEGYDDFRDGDADGIDGIEVVDERTLGITTTEAFAPLPQLLASPIFGVLPAASADDDRFFDAPVGSGPMMLAGEDANTEASSERPDGSDAVVVFAPSPGAALDVDAVQLVHFDEVADSYAAFADGALDWSLVPSDSVQDAVDEYGEDAMTPFHAEFFYGFNVAEEVFADADFREAIVRAVDRQAIVDEFFPNGIPLNGTVVEGVPGHQEDPCGDRCAYDPDEAESLLADAFGDDDPPEVQLDFYEGDRERDVAEAIADDLEAVGIPTELRPRPAGEYKEFVASGDQRMFLFGWVGIAPTADSYLAPLFLTGSLDNVTGFGVEAIDAGIAAARSFEDPAEQADAYQVVEDAVMSTVPLLPLVQVRTLGVVAPRVSGWQSQLDGTFVVSSVQLGE